MESNPYAPPQVTELSAPRSASDEAEAIRKEHISAENTVKSVGALYYLSAFSLTLVGISGIFALTASKDGSAIFTLMFLPIGVGLGFLAYGLRRLRPWTRWPTVALSIFGLLGFPIGTLISILILVNFIGKKGTMVFSPEYKDIIAATPHVKQKTSLAVKILLVILLLALIGIIAAVVMGG